MFRSTFIFSAAVVFSSSLAHSSPPPQPNNAAQAGGVENPENTLPKEIQDYVIQRGFRTRVEAAEFTRNRNDRLISDDLLGAPPITRGSAVTGTVEIPVIPFMYSKTPAAPFSKKMLQDRLYGTNPGQRSVTTHYLEMSLNKLTLTGEVYDWTKSSYTLAQSKAQLGKTLTEVLSKNDAKIDFSRYDNDGPDGRANSGDDDGVVDFMAFVHPSFGEECPIPGNKNIWSHKWTLEGYSEGAFETNDNSALKDANGDPIKIKVAEYVIQPSVSCDGKSLIDIGVYSHEFGHAFALPDLYNTTANANSSGIGGWGLMGSGSWGAQFFRPDLPTHMLAWSKEFLGWINPLVVEDDAMNIKIRPSVTTGDAIRIDYPLSYNARDERYLLLTYRKPERFDGTLPSSGLLITEVNNPVVRASRWYNRVNSLSDLHGIQIIEADGSRDLQSPNKISLGSHLFNPGNKARDLPAGPQSIIGAALCNVKVTEDFITLDIYVSKLTCDDEPLLGAAAVADELTPLERSLQMLLRDEK